jgi:hypothetical protein
MENDNPRIPSDGPLNAAEQADHARSVHDYPNIDFSPTEYVVIDVKRSIWGVVRIWLFALIVYAVVIAIAILVNQTSPIGLSDGQRVAMIGLSAIIPVVIGCIGTYDFNQCTFVVTSERVIAHIQNGPFSSRTQNTEIEHIRDCSYDQSGLMATTFNFGSIRLATIAEEQNYTFTFADNPREQFRVINRVVQRADEGKPPRPPRERETDV